MTIKAKRSAAVLLRSVRGGNSDVPFMFNPARQRRMSFRAKMWLCLGVLAFTALVGCTHAPVAQTGSPQPVISVEEEPTMIQVTSQRSGRVITPGIDIFADGRCLVRRFDGQELEKRLRVGKVRSLLQVFER